MPASATSTITQSPRKPKSRVCFSFGAYSKDLLNHLHHNSNVPIAQGLTDEELSAIESSFGFSFPPDLRSILQEGLPIGHGFPNWRSSSPQQLEILTSLPILGLCKEVRHRRFWHSGWGDRPEQDDKAVALAKGFLKNSPVLVPVYRNCYIPSTPSLAGNPVFYVNGLEVKLCSYDVVGFFHRTDFNGNGTGGLRPMSLANLFCVPVWAATEARKIEFWTELVELRRDKAAEGRMRRRWWRGNQLGKCLEEVRCKLIDGGWKEEDVEEMMMMMMAEEEMDGGDEKSSSCSCSSTSSPCSSTDNDDGGRNKGMRLRSREAVRCHVRELSLKLLRAGWSTGDVVDSLGWLNQDGQNILDEDSLFDFDHKTSCVRNGQKTSLKELMRMQSKRIF